MMFFLPKAAPLALIVLALAAVGGDARAQTAAPAGAKVAAPVAKTLPPPPPGATKGHAWATQDGRCAVWLSGDEPPAAGDQTRWSGACKNGYADGFGIQEAVFSDQSRQRYTGTIRNGMWNGLGRVQEWDSAGKPIRFREGLFRNDQLQGVASEVFVIDHPFNTTFIQKVRDNQVGQRAIGERYLQIVSVFRDDERVFVCSAETECVKEAADQGVELPEPDPADPLNKTLADGGWTIKVSTTEKSARTQDKLLAVKPLSLGLCMEKEKALKGREARMGVLLFPAHGAWLSYLKADQACEDLSATLDGQKLVWKSQCLAADGGERVTISQERKVSEKNMVSRSEAVATQGDKTTARSTKDMVGSFVGACTDDMVRAGSMGL